eukprot:CAMPEP_0170505670 /NCGR_PEP_ID=MMETSP0208-20121228/51799_1 /TAXON_ID=197538 /ORGANISM="Strombidium inclinatum, Strain S3" /LENGTH=64 /DNA_ID=CAMNT_0010786685 /DNA_START=123 /DNA_END=313 /DNA_ORIENTATION=-
MTLYKYKFQVNIDDDLDLKNAHDSRFSSSRESELPPSYSNKAKAESKRESKGWKKEWAKAGKPS